MKNIPRVMIAGTGSGCGKTTVTCGILKAFKLKNIAVSGFKCGPDFIDPMFHEKAIGVPSANLDIYLCGENGIKEVLVEKGRESLSIIEGVMGFYDGVMGKEFFGSPCHISKVTDTPVILVVNGKGRLLSAVAEILGFLNFAENNIKGIILNGIKPALLPYFKKEIEGRLGTKVLGCLPIIKEATIDSRHLGLITASEIDNIDLKLSILAEAVLQHIDLDSIIDIANDTKPIDCIKEDIEFIGRCRIGVAMDKAFCFYYKDNLEMLERLGAELVYFSPLEDKSIDETLSGLIFGGGYPELYCKELSSNKLFLKSLKDISLKGVPIYAECGGFIYLQESLIDNDGKKWSMGGLLKGSASMTDKLSRFGYIEMTAQKDNLLSKKGEKIKGHEFHYSENSESGNLFFSQKASGKGGWQSYVQEGNIIAGYPHVHFKGNSFVAKNFINACLNYEVHKCL